MPAVCGVDGGARPEEHERHSPGRCKEAQRTCVGERGGKCTGEGARAQHVSLVPEQQRAPGRGGQEPCPAEPYPLGELLQLAWAPRSHVSHSAGLRRGPENISDKFPVLLLLPGWDPHLEKHCLEGPPMGEGQGRAKPSQLASCSQLRIQDADQMMCCSFFS